MRLNPVYYRVSTVASADGGCPLSGLLSIHTTQIKVKHQPFLAPIRGTLGHSVCENSHITRDFEQLWKWAMEDLQKERRNHYDFLTTEEEKYEEVYYYIKRCYSSLLQWSDFDVPLLFREKRLRYGMVSGRIDRFTRDGSIDDWKFTVLSGNALAKGDYYAHQVGGYTWLMRKNHYEPKQFRFIIPKFTQVSEVVYDKEEMDDYEEDFEVLLGILKNRTKRFVATGKVDRVKSWDCRRCFVRDTCVDLFPPENFPEFQLMFTDWRESFRKEQWKQIKANLDDD
jgi:hypothetical protein